MDGKKHQFYVWYLGWKECPGLWGREFTEPIAEQLIRHRQKEDLPKLTIEVTKKELRLSQVTEGKKRSSSKHKFPPIQTKDLSFATVLRPPHEDVVSCIYMGYNPQTQRAVHTHVYRCDSPETAGLLVGCLNQIIIHPKHQDRLHHMYPELLNKGQIQPHPKVHPTTQAQGEYRRLGEPTTPPTNGFDQAVYQRIPVSPMSPFQPVPGQTDSNPVYEVEEAQINPTNGEKKFYPKGGNPMMIHMMNKELKDKLVKKDKPILFPGADYDTINRTRGNIYEKELRACQNPGIVGQKPPPSESTGDSARGDSDGSRGNSENGEGPSSPQTHRTGSSRGSSGTMEDVSPRAARHSRRYNAHARKSSGGSGVFIGEDDVDGGELQAISPRWKPANQVYVPPSSNRLSVTSSHSRTSSQDATDYNVRPFSPGPLTEELQTNSPFITTDSMPGYYLSDQAHAAQRHSSRQRGSGGVGVARQSSGDDGYTSQERDTDQSDSHGRGYVPGVAPRPKQLPRTPAYDPGDEIPIDYTLKGIPANFSRAGTEQHF